MANGSFCILVSRTVLISVLMNWKKWQQQLILLVKKINFITEGLDRVTKLWGIFVVGLLY